MQLAQRVTATRSNLPPLARIGERYRNLTEIGSGGFSTVYRATDNTNGREVAIKTPKTDRQESIMTITVERDALSRIRHQNVVTLLNSGLENEIPFLVLEYLSGSTLRREMVTGLPKSRVFEILVELTNALTAVHQAGIVHRDLKPENIMATAESRITLFDFGAACGRAIPSLSNRYASVQYMAPEIPTGMPIGITADIYALGIIGHELLCWEAPFTGDSSAEVVKKHIFQPPPSIAEMRPDLQVSSGVEAILSRALAKNPRNRFQSALEMREALLTNAAWFE